MPTKSDLDRLGLTWQWKTYQLVRAENTVIEADLSLTTSIPAADDESSISPAAETLVCECVGCDNLTPISLCTQCRIGYGKGRSEQPQQLSGLLVARSALSRHTLLLRSEFGVVSD